MSAFKHCQVLLVVL